MKDKFMLSIMKKIIENQFLKLNNVASNRVFNIVMLLILSICIISFGFSVFSDGSKLYKMDCSYETGSCVVSEFDFYHFKYNIKHKILLPDINKMVIRTKKINSRRNTTGLHQLYLATKTGDVLIENTNLNVDSNMNQNYRLEQVKQFDLFLKGETKTFEYKQPQTIMFLGLIVIFVGLSILLSPLISLKALYDRMR